MNNKGVTLFELLVVIVIISILASILSISINEILSNVKKRCKCFINRTNRTG